MNALALKGVAGVLVATAAAGTGYGISRVARYLEGGFVKSKLSDNRRWLESSADAIEWDDKVNKYKNQKSSDLSTYGFEIKNETSGESEHTVRNQNIAKMQVTCSKILDLGFSENLFEVAQKWCSVKKKVGWMAQTKNPNMRSLSLDAGDANKDDTEWQKKFDELKKDNSKQTEMGVTTGSGDVQELKNKCLSLRKLFWNDNKDKEGLFKEFCMIAR